MGIRLWDFALFFSFAAEIFIYSVFPSSSFLRKKSAIIHEVQN